jgi:predicted dehydrogenase/threonine dehydrogenase-like Zn-dependent dehydrogenase
MRQVVQNYNSGELRVEDVPVPACRSGGVLVRTAYSLVSAGTERMKVEQAQMGLLAKARARPDKVRQVMESIRQTGVLETWNKVRERLDALTPLGYSLAGVVEEVGAGCDGFKVGDRVACAGERIACHAEFAFVPRNLCVRVPDRVDLKDAAFATVGAIAMNGVRQAGLAIGDCVVVIGLGLVGLLAVQIFKAAGCRVVGVDLDAHKLDLARVCGADLALQRGDAAVEGIITEFAGGVGADAAYIAASADSGDPMGLAGRVLRDRGRIVVVGMIRVEADWQTYYQKELSVVMSRSYGPGRYDRTYEQKGIDYPIGYVRWTEGRNLEEFVRLLGTGQVKPSLLSPALYPIGHAPEAYQQLHDVPGQHAVGILFEYPQGAPVRRKVTLSAATKNHAPIGRVGIGLIGAGNFATATLIPALKATREAELRAVCSSGGLSARSAARRHGFAYAASNYRELLADPGISAVVIATHHDTHASFAAEALRAGKHVFVEKPLALTLGQLSDVLEAQSEAGKMLMVGYNRRFSPLSVAVRDFFAERAGPIEVLCRVNAGAIKGDSWYADAEESGWRIVSEGCHFVDLIQFICGSAVRSVYADHVLGPAGAAAHDNCAVTLKMEDGSLATLLYVANGDPSFEKERIEVFGQGRSAVIDNWQSARLIAGGKTRKSRPFGSGKGHAAELAAFVKAVATGGPAPLPLEDAARTTLCTLAIVDSMRSGCVQELPEIQSTPAPSPAVGNGDVNRQNAEAPR